MRDVMRVATLSCWFQRSPPLPRRCNRTPAQPRAPRRRVSTLTAPSEAVQYDLLTAVADQIGVSTLTAPSEAVQSELRRLMRCGWSFQRSPPLPRRCNKNRSR